MDSLNDGLIYLFMARPMCAFDGAHTDARPGYPPSADTPGLFLCVHFVQ